MTRVIRLKRAFWTSVGVSIAWMAIPLAIYYAVQGIMGFSTFLIFAVGVLALILALPNSITERLTLLRVEIWRIAAFLAMFLFFGLSLILGPAPSYSPTPEEQAIFAIYRVITVITMLIVLWRLVRAVRDSSVSAQ